VDSVGVVLLHSGALEKRVHRVVGPELGGVVVVPGVVVDLQSGSFELG
jgi:hypothetical protein